MKAENLAKLMLDKCLTKKGKILASDFDMLYHIIYNPKAKKRTFWWVGNGKRFAAKDTYFRDVHVLKKLGVDYSFLNDAPRGGKNGEYLIITEKGYRRIKPFVAEVRKYAAQGYNNFNVYSHLLDCIMQIAYPNIPIISGNGN